MTGCGVDHDDVDALACELEGDRHADDAASDDADRLDSRGAHAASLRASSEEAISASRRVAMPTPDTVESRAS